MILVALMEVCRFNFAATVAPRHKYFLNIMTLGDRCRNTVSLRVIFKLTHQTL